jgi:hypothetical protein
MSKAPASLKAWEKLGQMVHFRISFLVIRCISFFVVAKRTAIGIQQGSLMG